MKNIQNEIIDTNNNVLENNKNNNTSEIESINKMIKSDNYDTDSHDEKNSFSNKPVNSDNDFNNDDENISLDLNNKTTNDISVLKNLKSQSQMENIFDRLRKLEENNFKNFDNIQSSINSFENNNIDAFENIGKYLLSGNKNYIEKTIGITDSNRESISISEQHIKNKISIIRLLDYLKKVNTNFGDGLSICNFYTTENNQQAKVIGSSSYNDIEDQNYIINDPSAHVKSVKPVTINYYTSIMQSLNASNIEYAVTENILYQLYKKENDLIINSTEQNNGFMGLNEFFSKDDNHIEVNYNEFNDDTSTLKSMISLVNKVANYGNCEFWMNASTFNTIAQNMNFNYNNKLNINDMSFLGFPIRIIDIPKLDGIDSRIWFGNFKTINVGVSNVKFSTVLNNRRSSYDISGTETFSMLYKKSDVKFLQELRVKEES